MKNLLVEQTLQAVIVLTRNASQSLAYSPLGAIVSPTSEYLWKNTYLLITSVPNSHAPL